MGLITKRADDLGFGAMLATNQLNLYLFGGLRGRATRLGFRDSTETMLCYCTQSAILWLDLVEEFDVLNYEGDKVAMGMGTV